MMSLFTIYWNRLPMSTELAEIDDTLKFAHLSPTIAAELAAGLIAPVDVPEKYKMTDEAWEKLKKNRFFIEILKDMGERFRGDLGAGARITLKSEILLEEALPILDGIIQNRDGSTQSKLDSVKQLTVLAGRTQKVDGKQLGGGGGFNVSIIIDPGAGRDVEAHPIIDITPTED